MSDFMKIVGGLAAASGLVGLGYAAVKAEEARLEALKEEIEEFKTDRRVREAFNEYLKAANEDDAVRRSVYAEDCLSKLRQKHASHQYPVLTSVLQKWAKREVEPTKKSSNSLLEMYDEHLPKTEGDHIDACAELQLSDQFRVVSFAESASKAFRMGSRAYFDNTTTSRARRCASKREKVLMAKVIAALDRL